MRGMKQSKSQVFFMVFAIFWAVAADCYAEGGGVQPPPLSQINMHSGVGNINNRIIFNQQKTGDFKMTGFGDSLDYTHGYGETLGGNFNLFLMGLSADDENSDMSGFVFSAAYTPIIELVGGEKKSAAGEIESLGFSLSLFGGPNVMLLGFDSEMQSQGRKTNFTMTYATFGLTGGVVADIPLGSMISFMPFFKLDKTLGGNITTDMGGSTDTKSLDETPMTTSYGVDIILRPFRNSPNWKLSVGTALQQVEANQSSGEDTDNKLIMFGIYYEWGKAYSEMVFGPVTH